MYRITYYFKKIFVEETNDTMIQFIRYVFVGGTAFVADAAALWLLSLVMHYLIAAGTAFVVGLLVNYALSKLFVFIDNSIKATVEFVVYAVIGIIGLGITELLMYLFTEKAGIYFMLSKIITAVIVLVWNFGARKVILYGRKK